MKIPLACSRRHWLQGCLSLLAWKALRATPFQEEATPLDVSLEGAQVVTPQGVLQLNIGIRQGRIRTLSQEPLPARKRMQLAGHLVLPGGVDPHVHAATPWGETRMRGYGELTRKAAAGGTTTIIDFIRQEPGEDLSQALERKQEMARRESLLDYTFHMIVTDPAAALPGIGKLVRAGITSFKMFMFRLDLGEILEVMGEVARQGGMVSLHAALPGVGTRLAEQILKRHGSRPVRLFPEANPPWDEEEAVHLAITLAEATGATLYLHHVSTPGAAEHIRQARARGLPVWGETCPHYLLLDDSLYQGEKGYQYVVRPPLRPRRQREQLWGYLQDGTLQSIGSDDACFPLEAKRAAREDFEKVPPGGCGAGDRLALLLDRGLFSGPLSAEQTAALLAGNPARIFGLYPRKGVIAPGSDADLAVVDPRLETVFPVDRQPGDYSLFEGLRGRGRVVVTLLRGEVIMQNGEVTGEPGKGIFLARSPLPSRHGRAG